MLVEDVDVHLRLGQATASDCPPEIGLTDRTDVFPDLLRHAARASDAVEVRFRAEVTQLVESDEPVRDHPVAHSEQSAVVELGAEVDEGPRWRGDDEAVQHVDGELVAVTVDGDCRVAVLVGVTGREVQGEKWPDDESSKPKTGDVADGDMLRKGESGGLKS
ncbi:MAG: hypothetical protein P1U38_03285 [Aeromicrobium sp.]|uniref:hypothetical protein n=1 Tax=Aeromicrobium sp. TaxID=1871063 RepID=UPI00261691B0|nr:hypothetical protein [Aeromicrobium sp.]MDF1703775.1 hypothetical protein [Aeromicrobium sp.]